MMKRQTVWLVSILSLMVVLSAYYLMTGDVNQMDAMNMNLTENNAAVPTEDITSTTTESTQATDAAKADATKTDATQTDSGKQAANGSIPTPVAKASSSDYFDKIKMDRDNVRSMQIEDLRNITANANNSAEQIAVANSKIEAMTEAQYTESVVEETLAAQYGNAVVLTNDNTVQVVVQAESMQPSEVVKIINTVTQQMKVPASHVRVSYQP